MTFEIINPESLGVPRGWNNGMLAPAGGRMLFVAGQVAADAEGRVHEAPFVQQFGDALARIVTIVEEAGGTAENIGRLTFYVTDIGAYRSNLKLVGSAYRQLMGRHFPAMALVEVKALVDPNAKIEIEATAVLPA